METTISDAHRKFIDEDLHLSPRSRKTYDYAIKKFLAHVEEDYGLDPGEEPVTGLEIEHVTNWVAHEMPADLRTPEDISRMRTLQTQLAAVRKWYGYLAAFDFHPTLSTDKLTTRVQALMPRFTPPPPDVYQDDLETIIDYVRTRQTRGYASERSSPGEGAGDDSLPLQDRREGLGTLQAVAPRHRHGQWRRLYLPRQGWQEPDYSLRHRNCRGVGGLLD